jgi:hypothetical protein
MFLNFSVSGQGKKGEIVIDDSNIKTWIQAKANDYQSLYHFSNSEAESNLVLIMDQDSCYAQIQSGEWGKIDGKDHWIVKIETLKNVRINGNRFFSDKTNGEFVIFNHDNKQLKALMVYKPWSSWIFFANGKGFEMGNSSGPVDTHFPGKFPQASYRQLDKDELAKMTHSDLQLMRNEIYARYGYIFKPHGEMDLYFNKQSWYRGQNKNIDDCLTGLERRNIELIQSAENSKSTF